MASLNLPSCTSARQIFPPEVCGEWEKRHWRIERRDIVRMPVEPEHIGLYGCRQIIAYRRECHELDPRKAENEPLEIRYYVSSLAYDECTDEEMLKSIRDHWGGIENGTHLMRDVSMGEDKCRVRNTNAARILSSLRNLSVALYELALENNQTIVDSYTSWRRRMDFNSAHSILMQ